MTKSMPNKLHLKQNHYSHRLTDVTSVIDHISMFKEIVTDLEIMGVEYDDEDLEIILSCSLPPSCMNFKDVSLYGRNTLTLEEVYETLCTKETVKQLVDQCEVKAEGFVARDSKNSDRGGQNINKNKPYKYCKKIAQFIDDCYKLQNKNKATVNQKGKQSINFDQVSVIEYEYSDGELLVILVAIPALLRNKFLIWVVGFICVSTRTNFQHMKLV